MKISLYCVLISSFFLTACISGDRDYIETPQSSQSADLYDDDNDGVINFRDKCAGTVVGAKINNDGCVQFGKKADKKQLKILFANDSSEISPIFREEIRTMADFLIQYPRTSIQLQGFASSIGNSEYNMHLSQLRASAVKVALTEYGVPPKRIEIIGFGDTLLADKNNTLRAHAYNRRVVATVVGFKGDVVKEWNIFTRKPGR